MIAQLEKDPASLLDAFSNGTLKNLAAKVDRIHRPILTPYERVYSIYAADLRTLIPSLHLPVLLMHGTADQIIPVEAAHWLDHHLPESQLITYEGLGHALAAHALSNYTGGGTFPGVKYRIVG